MNSITGTNHLAYYNGTACPITLPFDGVSWLKITKEQYVKGVAYEGGNEENLSCTFINSQIKDTQKFNWPNKIKTENDT